MRKIILKRLIVSFPLLLGMTFITFLFIQIAPGDFLDTLKLNPQVSPQVINFYKEKFHLDKPVVIQYFSWLKSILKLDWGYSFTYKAPVIKVITLHAFNTLILSLSTIVFSWLFVFPLGIICVRYKERFIDKTITFFSYIFISFPTFLLAIFLLYLATFIDFLPLGGMRSLNFDELSKIGKIFDILKHLIIPTLVLSLGSIAYLVRILRANLFEVLSSPFMNALKARGLPKRKILFHALKNSLNPMITIFGYQLSGLLSGAALTEIICSWPGLGQVMLGAVRSQDLYLVMASVFIGGLLLILGNLVADILLAWVDPRIRYERF